MPNGITTQWRKEHEEWVAATQAGGDKESWQDFCRTFPFQPSRNAYGKFVAKLRDGGHVVPQSSGRIFTDEIVRLQCKAALITSDWQIPYQDREWAEFAFKVGKGFGCDLHVINGDFLDASAISKYDPQMHDEGHSLEEEFRVAEEIFFQSAKAFPSTIMTLGNHEWRATRALLKSQISSDRFLRLMSDEDRVRITELSQLTLNEAPDYCGVRVSHPKSYSRIAARVGVALASKHHQHVVVGHDHAVGQARDLSSKYTVIHSGLIADPRRLAYANTSDSTAPNMSQGFVVLDYRTLYLFDRLNTDQEFWLWALAKGRKPKEAAA